MYNIQKLGDSGKEAKQKLGTAFKKSVGLGCRREKWHTQCTKFLRVAKGGGAHKYR
jgi:hypothetical protein